MSGKAEIAIRPRLVNKTGLARYLGYSLPGLNSRLPNLRAKGFPDKVDALDRFDLVSVDRWLDSLSVAQRVAGDDITAARLRHGRKSAF